MDKERIRVWIENDKFVVEIMSLIYNAQNIGSESNGNDEEEEPVREPITRGWSGNL